jgi:hypothetical protein
MNVWTSTMPLNPSLAEARRLPLLGATDRGVALAELALLVGMGAMAAGLSAAIDGWKIPGSNLLQSVLPMAAGLALVPRRGSGAVMGTSAVMTSLAFAGFGGVHITPSTFARLFLLGACLDVAAAAVARRGNVWLWFVLAGLAANMLGFAFKMACAQFGWEGLGGARWPFQFWPARAASFAFCGALAGGVSGMIFFRRSPQEKGIEDSGLGDRD